MESGLLITGVSKNNGNGRGLPPAVWEKIMRKKNSNRELKLERFLGNGIVLAVLLILEDVLLFLIVNYLFNIVLNIGSRMEDLPHPQHYLGIENCIPDMDRIHKYGEIYGYLSLVYVCFCIFIDIRQAYRMRASFSDKGFNLNQKGSARWATTSEIKQQYIKIPDREKAFPGYGGTIVSRIKDSLYIDTDIINNLYIGITRSGKGEMFVIPSIDVHSRAEKKTSMVVLDPKTELYKTSKETLEKRGYDVYLLSLVDPEHSMGFNPLSQIIVLWEEGDCANAELLVQTFCYSIFNPDKPTNGDTFWQDSPTCLLASLVIAVMEDVFLLIGEENASGEKKKKYLQKINLFSIINLFGELVSQTNPDNPYITGLDMFFEVRPPLDRAKIKFFGVKVAGTRTKASIYSSMLMKLTIFTYENFAKMTAESTLDLEDIGFGDKPVAVFIEMPDYDKSAHFLGSVFIRQLYFVLARRATREKNGKCKNRVKIIADEFGNMPAIEAMETIITVCLGRNISFDLYIQAYAQMNKLYGENAKTIAGNCGNTIYILSDDDETTEKFSKNLGNETIIDMQRNGKRLSGNKTIMETPLEKPLLNMNQLEELRPGECVVKRVMKRRDRKGRLIKPHPIFNSVENGRRLLFRHEYLTDTFPNPDEVDMQDVNHEDLTHIDIHERVWNYRLSFALYNFVSAQQEKKAVKEKETTMGDLENSESLTDALTAVLGVVVTRNMRTETVVELLEEAELDERTKGKYIELLHMGKEDVMC